MADRVGQQLGNYRLVRILGQGGFADVYLGEHIHLSTQAAIKVLRTQLAGDDLAHFRAEARTIAHLVHPNIIQVLDFGVEGSVPFLVMAYAPNGTLRQRHRRGIPLPTATIVGYVKQVASALQYAHNQRLIHRDIKPENMLLGRDNEVLLSDFGIALVTPSARAQSLLDKSMPNQHTWDPAGTVTYMAPEQIQGRSLPASDQYALAVVVYEWFTGLAPFNGAYMEIAMQHMSAPPPRLRDRVPTISLDVERVVLTALAKDPQQRFVSVQAFATALEQSCQPELSTIMAPMPGISTPQGRQSGGLSIEAALSGPSGRTILRSAVITIGRRPDNQLIVNDAKVSSHHAEIRSMAQGYCLIDLHSTNGTLVNGQPLVPQTPHLLSPGDIVLFGDTRFTYEVSGASQVRAPTSDGSTVRAEPGYSGVMPPVVPPPVGPINTGYGAQPANPSQVQPSFYPPAAQQQPMYTPPVMTPPAPAGGINLAPPGNITPAQFNASASLPPASATPVLPEGQYMGFTGIPAGSIPTTLPPKRPSPRGLWIVLSVILALLLIGGGVIGYVYISSQPTPTKTLDAFCTDLQNRDYQAAYTLLSSGFQNKTSEKLFDSFYTNASSCTHGSPSQGGNNATADLTTSATGRTNNDHVTLVQDSTNAWKIDEDANLSGLTKTLSTYCSSVQRGDYQTAFDQFSSKLQGKLAEALFASFFTRVSACTYDSLAMTAGGATITLMTTTASGQTSDPVTLIQDSSGWRIDDFASLPDKTLDTFCNALQQKDYQTAYSQTSTAFQGGFPESQFAQLFANFTSCTHDPAAPSNSNILANTTLGTSAGQSAIFLTYLIRDSSTSKWKIDKLDNPPYTTLETFCNALINKDYQTAYNQLSAGLQSAVTEAQFANAFSGVTTCTHNFPAQSGNTATATMVLGNGSQTVTDKVVLIQVSNNDWRIDSIQQA